MFCHEVTADDGRKKDSWKEQSSFKTYYFSKLVVIIQGMLNKSDYVCSEYDMTYEELLVLPQLKTRSVQHNFCYHPT